MHGFVLCNDRIVRAQDHCVSPAQVGFLNGWGVFSTLRVRNGVLFAYDRHFARMERDARLLRVPFPDDSGWLRARLESLIQANQVQDCTLRVVVMRNKGGIFALPDWERDFDLVAITADTIKWGGGVKLYVVPQGRHAASPFAGTKVTSWAFNLTLYEEAHARGFDEVVLLNEHGNVSECTSANIFIARNGEAITPPLSAGCLPGITRQLLVEGQVRAAGIRVREQDLTLEDLQSADEVFITSSTRNVLGVDGIEGLTISHNRLISQELLKAFDNFVDEYCGARTLVR